MKLLKTRKNSPRWFPPDPQERLYRAFLFEMMRRLERSVKDQLIKRLPQLARDADKTNRTDDYTDELERILASLVVEHVMSTERAEAIASAIGQRVSAFNARQFAKVLKVITGTIPLLERTPFPLTVSDLFEGRMRITVDPLSGDPALQAQLKAFAKENAKLIVSMPENALREIEGIAYRGLAGGARAEDMAKDIQNRFDVSRRRARLIALDQTGKLSGNLAKVRQTGVGIREYEWRDVEDGRVRESHKTMHGKICRWDDPTVYLDDGEWKSRSGIGGVMLHPGQDIRCRCYSAPVLEGLE